jgi:hypothetical protein
LILALTTIPANFGYLDPIPKCAPVRKAPAAIALQVLSLGNIVNGVHGNPDIATRGKAVDGRNEQWIVNSHIDLATGNDVYN